MNSKERVKRAIEFGKPDRVPYSGANIIAGVFTSDIFPVLPTFNKDWQPKDSPPNYPHVDWRLINLGIYKWDTSKWNPPTPKNWHRIELMEVDEWGAYWYCLPDDNTMGHPSKPAIENWDDIDSINVPNTRWERFKLFNNFRPN